MMSFLFLGFLYMTGSLWMRVVVWGNGLFPGVLHGFFYSACLLPQAAPDDFYEFCVFFKFFRRWFVGFLFLGGKAGGSFQEGYPAGAFKALDGACYFFPGYFLFVRALRFPEEFFQLALSSFSSRSLLAARARMRRSEESKVGTRLAGRMLTSFGRDSL